MKKIDIVGLRFSRLLVLELAESRVSGARKRIYWKCRCDCGAEKLIEGWSLRGGYTKSCGCLVSDDATRRFTTHGGSRTRLFKIWKGMRARCNSPKNQDYKNYGARGIHLCEAWNDFAAFRDDMGGSYVPGLSIERIDVDKGYEPVNCKWIPMPDQAKNKQNSILVETPKGLLTIADAAREAGIQWVAMKYRVDRKWPMDRLFDPPRRWQE